MICGIEVAFTIMGIVAMYKQKLKFSRGKVLTGIPAILVGLLLAGTFPIAFVMYIGIAIILAAMNPNIPVDMANYPGLFFIELGTIVILGITAAIATAIFGHHEDMSPLTGHVPPTFADPLAGNPHLPPRDPSNPYSPPNTR